MKNKPYYNRRTGVVSPLRSSDAKPPKGGSGLLPKPDPFEEWPHQTEREFTDTADWWGFFRRIGAIKVKVEFKPYMHGFVWDWEVDSK